MLRLKSRRRYARPVNYGSFLQAMPRGAFDVRITDLLGLPGGRGCLYSPAMGLARHFLRAARPLTSWAAWGAIGGLAIVSAGGCVERTLTVQTSPSGSLVTLNDQEVGRAPMTLDFTYYGDYDLALRKEGFVKRKTTCNVKEPWFQIPPIDLIAAVLPLHFIDRHTFTYDMTPAAPPDPSELMQRAEGMRSELEGSSQPPRPTVPVVGSHNTHKEHHHPTTQPGAENESLEEPTAQDMTAPNDQPGDSPTLNAQPIPATEPNPSTQP
jgi:hypothetical protein